MLDKTITKFSLFVISLAIVSLFFSGCFSASSSNRKDSADKNISADYQKPQVVGKIESNEINESSGIAASKCQPDVFWTHNDSGDDAFIFAINSKGEKLGTWKVSDAKNRDWEDIAAYKNTGGECFLYIGDIGNNDLTRSEQTIYRVKEPQVSGANKSSNRKNPAATESAAAIKIEYPDARHNAETLMVHPKTGDIYVLSKQMSGASGVYKLAAADYSPDKTNILKKIADFSVPSIPNGLLTGGDISPDGKRVITCDYFDAYEIVLPDSVNDFDQIWKQPATVIDLGERKQGEAVGYSADGKSIFATSEERNQPFIQVRRK